MPTPAGDQMGTEVGTLPYSVKVFGSAARTADPVATTDGGFSVPSGSNAAMFVINCTAITSTPSVVFNIEGYDHGSATWISLLASVAVTAAGTTVLQIIPAGGDVANYRADTVLPAIIRVRPVHANGNSITYSVGAVFTAV